MKFSLTFIKVFFPWVVVDGLYNIYYYCQCSASCEGGWRRRAVECHEGYSVGIGCEAKDKPAEKEECNAHHCPTWRMGGWTKVN